MEEMREISRSMKESLLTGNVKLFGDLLHESWVAKKKVNSGVTNPFVEECYETARNLGALGGKLLGAGESGYLLIFSSPKFQRDIQNALQEKGLQFEPLRFSDDGLEVWSTPI